MDEMRKKTRQYITNDEMWLIYQYAIKNHCISQNGAGIRYRVTQTMIADEMNATGILNRKITGYHVNKTIMEIIDWETRFNKFPEPQETMELEQLREQHTKDINEIEKLKLQVSELQKEMSKYKNYQNENDELKTAISRALVALKI